MNTKLFSRRFVDDEISEMLGRKITTDDLNFVSYLTQSNFVYLKDIYKIYYQTKDKNGQNLLSNKDRSFTEKKH